VRLFRDASGVTEEEYSMKSVLLHEKNSIIGRYSEEKIENRHILEEEWSSLILYSL
jgi:hypothetical protein